MTILWWYQLPEFQTQQHLHKLCLWRRLQFSPAFSSPRLDTTRTFARWRPIDSLIVAPCRVYTDMLLPHGAGLDKTSLRSPLHLPLGGEVQPTLFRSCSSTVRSFASQPPRRRVEGSRCLPLVVEAPQVLLPIVVDVSLPLAATLGPAHAHEL